MSRSEATQSSTTHGSARIGMAHTRLASRSPVAVFSPAAARALATVLALAAVLALVGCSPDHSIRASGMIEMDEIDVASQVGGRIVLLRADEGDTVRAGDTLAVLARGELAAEFLAQLAQAERAAAESREIRNGPRAEEVQGARADLASAEADFDLARRTLERTESLIKSQVATPAELDRARAAATAMAARREAARERLRLLELGSRREAVVAAASAAEGARASAQAAQSRLGELVLTAPVSGVVLLRNFRTGEVVLPAQPVVTLGDPDSLWIRVYVAAPRIGEVRLGAPVDLRVTGFGSRQFHGRVVEIASKAEFTPRAALTEEERAHIVFGVKVALDRTGGALKAGLPADARIRAAGGAGGG